MTAEDLGMPFHKRSFKFGNLFIRFDVKFPKALTEIQMNNADSCLADQYVHSKQGGGKNKKKNKGKGGG